MHIYNYTKPYLQKHIFVYKVYICLSIYTDILQNVDDSIFVYFVRDLHIDIIIL